MAANLTKLSKELRKNSTDVERVLWQKLRARQFYGIKFRRQQPIGNFIVDFVSFEKNLIIELDGGQHAENKQKDLKRDRILSNEGFNVLRFWNNEIMEYLDGVLERIREAAAV